MPRLLALAAGAMLAAPAPALDPSVLARYMPAPANAAASVNVQQLLRSPRAQKEGWAKIEHTEYLAGAVPLNPLVRRMVISSEFVPSHPVHGGGVLVAETDGPLDLAAIAKAGHGTPTEVAGEPALVTPTGLTITGLGPNVVGGMATPHKPELARWARAARPEVPKDTKQSLYIGQTLYNFAPNHHILVVLDTEDLYTRDQLGAAAAASAAAQADPQNAPAFGRFLTGLRGLRFTADLDAEGFNAMLHVDSTAPAPVPAIVKAFALEVLDKSGAPLTDLRAATPSASGNSVALRFRVTDRELALILSPFVAPASALPYRDVIAVAPDGPTPERTARYLRSADAILGEVGQRRDPARGVSEKAYKHAAVWYGSAAQKLDSLSTVGVDPAAVDFARGTAGRLHAVADSLSGVPIEAAKLDATKYAYAYGGGGGYFNPFVGRFAYNPWGGFGGVSTNVGQVNNEIVKVIEKDAASREAAWKQVTDERAKVRGYLAKKYGREM